MRAEAALRDVGGTGVERAGIAPGEGEVFRRHPREVDMQQRQVGGHEVAHAADMIDVMAGRAPSLGDLRDQIGPRRHRIEFVVENRDARRDLP